MFLNPEELKQNVSWDGDFLTTEYLLDKEVDCVLRLLTPANRLITQVMLHTGLRVSDVLDFRTEQLKSRFWVTERKTGKKKMVGLPRPLLDELKKQAGKIYVFESARDPGKHRSRQAVFKDIKRAAKSLRLQQCVAPHSFRKIYAVDLLQKYGDIEKVRKALNHERDSTTLIYALAAQQLEQRQAVKAYRPYKR